MLDKLRSLKKRNNEKPLALDETLKGGSKIHRSFRLTWSNSKVESDIIPQNASSIDRIDESNSPANLTEFVASMANKEEFSQLSILNEKNLQRKVDFYLKELRTNELFEDSEYVKDVNENELRAILLEITRNEYVIRSMEKAEKSCILYLKKNDYKNANKISKLKIKHNLSALLKKKGFDEVQRDALVKLAVTEVEGKKMLAEVFELYSNLRSLDLVNINSGISMYLIAAMIRGFAPRLLEAGNEPYYAAASFFANNFSKVPDFFGDRKFNSSVNQIVSQMNQEVFRQLFLNSQVGDVKSGEAVEIINSGMTALEELLKNISKNIFPTVAQIAVTMTFLGITKPITALGGVLLTPVTIGVMMSNNKRKKKIDLDLQQSKGSSNDAVINNLQALPEIKTASAKSIDKVINTILLKLKSTIETKQKYENTTALNGILTECIYLLASVVVGSVETLKSNYPENKIKGKENSAAGQIISIHQLQSLVMQLMDSLGSAQIQVQKVNTMMDLLGVGRFKALRYDQVELVDREKIGIATEQLKGKTLKLENVPLANGLNLNDLEVKPGEIIMLEGPSGIGKSTLLRKIAKLEQPGGNGKIFMGELDINNMSPEHNAGFKNIVSMTTASPNLIYGLSLKQNLTMCDDSVSHEEVERVLEQVGLSDLKARLNDNLGPTSLSTGQKTRLGIARLLVKKDTNVLLLDEPTTGLDTDNARIVIELIKKYKQENPETTLVVVTHDHNLKFALRGEVKQFDLATGKEIVRIKNDTEEVVEAYNTNSAGQKTISGVEPLQQLKDQSPRYLKGVSELSAARLQNWKQKKKSNSGNSNAA